MERFVNAADLVDKYDSKRTESPIDFAFNILDAVANASSTQWSIVFNIADLSIQYKTIGNRKVRYFNLKSFDFACSGPTRVLDINADLSGDVTARFVDYTYQMNRNLIRSAFRKTYFLKNIPDHALDRRSRYPENNTCVEK